jgi:hypothetical protein
LGTSYSKEKNNKEILSIIKSFYNIKALLIKIIAKKYYFLGLKYLQKKALFMNIFMKNITKILI